jgi:hypothetical protein
MLLHILLTRFLIISLVNEIVIPYSHGMDFHILIHSSNQYLGYSKKMFRIGYFIKKSVLMLSLSMYPIDQG